MKNLGDSYLKHTISQEVVLDIDSTHSDTYGTHYGATGYHPLVAFDGLTGLLLDAKLRPGNVYTSNEAEDLLRPLLLHYNSYSCAMNLLVRGDSGFAKPEIYSLCEDTHTNFLIRLKANTRLQGIAGQLVLYGEETDFTTNEVQWNEINYQSPKWTASWRMPLG